MKRNRLFVNSLFVLPVLLALAVVFFAPAGDARAAMEDFDPIGAEEGHLFQEPGSSPPYYACACNWTPTNCVPCGGGASNN